VSTSTLRVEDRAIILDVPSIKEFEVVVSEFAVASDESLHVVKLAQPCREVDMSLIA
jgi:hypothetical protein